ncbi:hypothetical protein ACMC9I_08755 [Deinococcota bacterium DY0809b]
MILPFVQAFLLILVGVPAIPTIIYLAGTFGWAGYAVGLTLLLLATLPLFAAGRAGLARWLPFFSRYRHFIDSEYGFLAAAALPFMPYWVVAGATGATYPTAILRYIAVGFPSAAVAGLFGVLGHAAKLPPLSLILGVGLFMAVRFLYAKGKASAVG